MSLVPVLSSSMNWQAWRPTMMNYLLSQGQWKVIANTFPAPDYETKTTTTKSSEGGTQTETVADTSKPAKNQSDIDSWFDTILVGFTRMAASKCAVPPHLQAMILVSKLPYQMSVLVQSICQTDNIEDLKTDDIKRKAILAWEQRSPVQSQNNCQQSARRLSAVQRPGPPPQFQQQQQQHQQEEQDQGQGQ